MVQQGHSSAGWPGDAGCRRVGCLVNIGNHHNQQTGRSHSTGCRSGPWGSLCLTSLLRGMRRESTAWTTSQVRQHHRAHVLCFAAGQHGQHVGREQGCLLLCRRCGDTDMNLCCVLPAGGDRPYLISGADDKLVRPRCHTSQRQQICRPPQSGNLSAAMLTHTCLQQQRLTRVFRLVSLVNLSCAPQVKIWDYQTKACVQTLEGHTHNVACVCFHPELPLIVTGRWASRPCPEVQQVMVTPACSGQAGSCNSWTEQKQGQQHRNGK
jgi:hypothetical protein